VAAGYDERAASWEAAAAAAAGARARARAGAPARLHRGGGDRGAAAAARSGDARALAAVAVALALLFVALVRRHGRARAEHERARDLGALNRDGARRVLRDWSGLDGPVWPPPPAGHLYAADLDLFGDTGLVRLLPPVSAAAGRATLRGWLLAPAAPATSRERQAAVAELAGERTLRDELAVRAGRVWLGAAQVERLVAWGEAPGWLVGRPATLWAARLLPAATVVLVGLQLAGVVATPFWWGTLLAAGALTAVHRRALAETVAGVLPEAEAIAQYASLLEAAVATPLAAPALVRLQAALQTDGEAAHAQVARLRRLADAAETRRSPMLYLAVQLVTLWDFHVVWALERWKASAGPRLRGWLQALGELEALAALGALAHDNPGWRFPELADAAGGPLAARALAHPLLPPATAVANDVTVGPPGRFLLVTGSNMAGKSTLIRAVGLNAVLAQCGAPVCAEWMRCPPLAIATSIRVHDSLERGVSYFMAELERLKVITDAARAAGPGRLLFLLDEMLQGTNSADRTVAARQVIALLLRAGAIGAVTTHDLALAAPAGATDSVTARHVANAATVVHFAEQVHEGDGRAVMTFDFRMREGVATSTNALALLRLVGLGD
jgi:hypothetical protein